MIGSFMLLAVIASAALLSAFCWKWLGRYALLIPVTTLGLYAWGMADVLDAASDLCRKSASVSGASPTETSRLEGKIVSVNDPHCMWNYCADFTARHPGVTVQQTVDRTLVAAIRPSLYRFEWAGFKAGSVSFGGPKPHMPCHEVAELLPHAVTGNSCAQLSADQTRRTPDADYAVTDQVAYHWFGTSYLWTGKLRQKARIIGQNKWFSIDLHPVFQLMYGEILAGNICFQKRGLDGIS